MKLLSPSGILLALLAFPMAASAAFTTTFDGLTAPGQVAGQDGWTINEATPDNSFVVAGSGANKYAALGGLLTDPATAMAGINLVHSAGSQVAAGSTFSVSYALVNRSTVAGFNFAATDPDDWFGFTLGDGADVLSISFRPTSPVNESIRQVFNNGVGVTPNGITTSDYANPLFSTLTVSFTNVDGALNYTGSTGGGSINFNGSIPGKGATTFTTVGIDWDLKNTPSGQNFILVDNLSLVPEPSASLMGLLSIGLLAARRRR